MCQNQNAKGVPRSGIHIYLSDGAYKISHNIYYSMHKFIYLFISFFFNLGDPFNALALFFLGAQVAQGHT